MRDTVATTNDVPQCNGRPAQTYLKYQPYLSLEENIFNTTFRPHRIPKFFNMAHYLSLLALAAFAGASPVAQGVTDAVAPSATAPAACSTDYASRFGIAVMSAAANAAAPAATVSQIAGMLMTDA